MTVVRFPEMVSTEATEQVCQNCRFQSDEFTSVCVNGDSPRCADFVAADDTCEAFEVTDNG